MLRRSYDALVLVPALLVLAVGCSGESTATNAQVETDAGTDDAEIPPFNGVGDAGRYTVTDAGTVYDNVNMLEWQRSVISTSYTWNNAKTYCASLPPAGTWRLPSRIELLSLVDMTQHPTIDPIAFPSAPSDGFWTSSAVSGSSGSAWYVGFSGGGTYGLGVGFNARVRCVR